MSTRRASPTVAAPAEADGRWTVEQRAEYAAQRDFRLLQLLANDRRAFATARRLGLFSRSTQKQEELHQRPASATKRRTGSTQTPSAPDGAATLNSAQRRSRKRMEAHIARKRASIDAPPPQVPRGGGTATQPPGLRLADVDMGDGDAPPSPLRDRHVVQQERALREASETLDQRSAARDRPRGGLAGRDGPGLGRPSPCDLAGGKGKGGGKSRR